MSSHCLKIWYFDHWLLEIETPIISRYRCFTRLQTCKGLKIFSPQFLIHLSQPTHFPQMSHNFCYLIFIFFNYSRNSISMNTCVLTMANSIPAVLFISWEIICGLKMKSVHDWYPEKSISSNLAPSKTKTFPFGPSYGGS